jgi:hypothetical protein
MAQQQPRQQPQRQSKPRSTEPRNGKLSIPLPFDQAVAAALKVKPPQEAKKKRS